MLVDKITSVTEILRKYKEVYNKLDKENYLYIFKNNKPDKVIMTFEEYKRIINK